MVGHESLQERWQRWSARHERGDHLPEGVVHAVLHHLRGMEDPSGSQVKAVIHRVAGPSVSKVDILRAYRALIQTGAVAEDRKLLQALSLKPVRTRSGVAPVAVMTKPWSCPGQCIFCPDEDGMPKSYLVEEPGALRGLQMGFDPYRQTLHRIQALATIGHPTDKIELIVLGGTWSAYPRDYQEWFVKRCLDALNGTEAASLSQAQELNETAPHRCVGLAVETRPDMITPEEVEWLRLLGVTKVQVGVQSLDDTILELNGRGHTVEDTRRAFALLRSAGFKIHAHWMPNLLGASPESDLEDFARLWSDPGLRPDELKIYPCCVLEGTRLHTLWEQSVYQPYSHGVLVDLLARCKALVPAYCRITRVMRDIPVHHIKAGTRTTNLRQAVQERMGELGLRCGCIRCREVGFTPLDVEALELRDTVYPTLTSQEHFLSLEYPRGGGQMGIAAFLRLSLPTGPGNPVLPELEGAAVVREVHVYGPALRLGVRGSHAQHRGLGARLLEEAARIARGAGFGRLSVIAAVGTRAYYRARGFSLGTLYMHRSLP